MYFGIGASSPHSRIKRSKWHARTVKRDDINVASVEVPFRPRTGLFLAQAIRVAKAMQYIILYHPCLHNMNPENSIAVAVLRSLSDAKALLDDQLEDVGLAVSSDDDSDEGPQIDPKSSTYRLIPKFS